MFPNAFGIHNIGSTCYMSSVLQGLMSCSNLSQEMIDTEDIKEDSMDMEYLRFIYSKDKNPYQILRRVKFSRTQEDAHEYLLRMIDCFSKPFQLIFEFRIKEMKHCEKCDRSSKQELTENYIFMESFSKEYFNTTYERIEDFKCDCGEKNCVSILKKLVSIPKVMIIVLNRYNNLEKNYPLRFRLGEHEYELVAVISSSNGNVFSGGHYTCVARRNRGVFKFNDIHVTQLDGFPVNDHSAYVLFYNLV